MLSIINELLDISFILSNSICSIASYEVNRSIEDSSKVEGNLLSVSTV